MAMKYGLPSRLYRAVVGTLRSGEETVMNENVDFNVFVQALLELGFRTDDNRATAEVVVLYTPHQFAQIQTTIEIELRFRSVGFKTPTAEPPNDEDGKWKPRTTRPHDRDRNAAWRAKQDEEETTPRKQFLAPEEKKRIAFIKHEIHGCMDSVNVYVVFAHPPPGESRPANLTPLPPVMNPYEAAVEAAKLCDGSAFLGGTLRVDVVQKDASLFEKSKSIMTGDPHASKEEDLRAFFKTLLRSERGGPGEREEGARSGSVQFVVPGPKMRRRGPREQDKLKFAKRKLRVRRCKTLSGGSKLKIATVKPARGVASSAKPYAAASKSGIPLVPAKVPNGNSELDARLAILPKEERKRVL
ncbi:hypothetical protein FKP32DRAFT_1599732 [Trametes sanguinea]|nr:hypothetical protein FKP32DRAFT_1599732 [Trametes sanguinea]